MGRAVRFSIRYDIVVWKTSRKPASKGDDVLRTIENYYRRFIMMDPLTNRIRRYWPLALPLAIAGCGVVPDRDGPPLFLPCPNDAPNAVPRVEPKSRYGNPSSYVVRGKRYYVSPTSRGYVKRGLASWYGRAFHGNPTSSREPYDMCAMTAAHRSLPLPTYVRVTNLENNRWAIVRVNDRGPFYPNRIIDLSYAAALKLRLARKGTAFVEVRAIDPSGFARASGPIDATPEKAERLADSTPRETRPAKDAETAKPASSQEPLRESSGEGDLYLQVGAFANRASAERLKTRLRASVEGDVRIDAMQDDGRTLYKVQVGPFHDPAHADRIGEELARIGFDKLHVRFEPSRQRTPIAAGSSDEL